MSGVCVGIWSCEVCDETVEISYQELAIVGPPLCMDEACKNFENEMLLLRVERRGNTPCVVIE